MVRSQRDRRLGFIATSMKAIKNAAVINDWEKVLTNFDELSKGLVKAAVLLEKEGYPRNFIKMYARPLALFSRNPLSLC